MTAIQDQTPHHHCYGCGTENDQGLQIKSHWQGDECICHYSPRPEQSAGPLQYVYGGTIASIIDCHCVNAAMSNYYKLEGREVGAVASGAPLLPRIRQGEAPDQLPLDLPVVLQVKNQGVDLSLHALVKL